jgi:hypothetical protein
MSKEVSTDWKAALQAQLKTEVARTQEFDGLPQISLRHGRMVLNEQQVPNDELEVIILGHTYERSWYDREFDPEDQAPPECFALGKEKYDLIPHENVPNPPASDCKSCPWAEFGTARQGKGPACKTRVRLVVLAVSASSLDGSLKEPELAVIKVSPTSVANFDAVGSSKKKPGHLKNLAAAKCAEWSAVSKISMSMHPKGGYGVVNFAVVKPISDEKVLASVFGLIPSIQDDLNRAWSYETDDEAEDKPEAAGAKF